MIEAHRTGCQSHERFGYGSAVQRQRYGNFRSGGRQGRSAAGDGLVLGCTQSGEVDNQTFAGFGRCRRGHQAVVGMLRDEGSAGKRGNAGRGGCQTDGVRHGGAIAGIDHNLVLIA